MACYCFSERTHFDGITFRCLPIYVSHTICRTAIPLLKECFEKIKILIIQHYYPFRHTPCRRGQFWRNWPSSSLYKIIPKLDIVATCSFQYELSCIFWKHYQVFGWKLLIVSEKSYCEICWIMRWDSQFWEKSLKQTFLGQLSTDFENFFTVVDISKWDESFGAESVTHQCTEFLVFPEKCDFPSPYPDRKTTHKVTKWSQMTIKLFLEAILLFFVVYHTNSTL